MKKHDIARAAVSAGLAIAMTFGGIAPATMAFAAEDDNTITISNVPGNETSFKGYQIFKATVTDTDSGKSVSNITWAGSTDTEKTAVKNAVEGVIRQEEASYAGTTAQDAADWITAHVTGTNDTTVVDSNSIANKIAKAVDNLNINTTPVEGDKKSSALDSGYWLFVTDPSSVDNKVGDEAGKKNTETYTSPIFAVVGGSTVAVTEKASIPTVEKKIVSDADGKEYDAADSHVGQNVTYNIYGTVAQDFDTYDSYSYIFSDNVSKGLTVNSSSVKVYMYSSKDAAKKDLAHTSGTEVTSYFTTNLNSTANEDGSHDLTVTAKTTDGAKGLKSINVNGVKATKDSCFVVTYTAQINSDAVIGNDGNPNTVTLTYSNNPHSEGTGVTVPDKVRDFTYRLNLVKVDQGTEKALAGATFTIKVKNTDGDNDTAGKFVKSDGTLTSTEDEAKITTGADGTISIKGLDAGTYEVHEVSAPSGYSTVSDFTFQIKPTIDTTDQKITKLENVLGTTDSDHVKAGTLDPNSTKGDNVLTVTENSGATDLNTVNITVGDKKSVGLPLTGQAGVTVTFVAGALVLAFGVSRVVRNRKEQDAE